MFTGIIEAVGTIAELSEKGNSMRIRIASDTLDLSDAKLGDSIAVNGVCLTVIDLLDSSFWVDVSEETLKRSTFSHLRINSEVNLEQALRAGDRLGGHLVSGHVDGIGTLVKRQKSSRFVLLSIRAPSALSKYVAEKGSICVDGVSLTVNAIDGDIFNLTIVPHTLKETTLAHYKVGQAVNLEVDIIARYVERLLRRDPSIAKEEDAHIAETITADFLSRHGFAKSV